MKTLKAIEIKNWLKKYNINDYIINNDLTVSVNSSVDLGSANISSIPIKFKHIKGYFICSDNKITNLDFCPEIVTSFLDISSNKLTNLKGVSRIIGSNFIFNNNFVKTLKYAPQEVGKSILGNFNLIETLDLFSTEYKENFITSHRDDENYKIKGLDSFYKFNARLILTEENLRKYQLKLGLESKLEVKFNNELIKI